MKGFATSYIGTVIVAIVALVALLIILAIMICTFFPFCPVGPAQAAYAINYVDTYNTPYAIASVLSHYDTGGKTLMDYAYEALLSGGMSDSDKEYLAGKLKELLDKYRLNYYEIFIKTGKDEALVQFGSSVTRCGSNLQGVCMANPGQYDNGVYVGRCDVGRKIITDVGRNGCGFGLLCCAPATEIEYFDWLDEQEKIPNAEKMKVVKCGIGESGVCQARPCSQSEVSLDGNCKYVNNGKTQHCCSTNPDVLKDIGKVGDAEIPLFYGEKSGILVVRTSD
ncbi:MAG: hypothetical protein HY365_01215 [Candidatus Aenigmarchaeota archaeon]|nr:hypothetical protein [Candidatus Aenigmarchaeota archaeon]